LRNSKPPETLRTWSIDPLPPTSNRKTGAGSNRRSGVIGRRTDRQRIWQNALIRRDVRILKGSGGWRRGRSSAAASKRRAEARRRPEAGRTASGSGAESRTSLRATVQGSEVAGQERRSWNGLCESGGRCRGAKGRHERPVLFWRETAARLKALSLVVEKKTPLGEQRGKRRTALRNTKLSAVHAGGEQSWTGRELETQFPPRRRCRVKWSSTRDCRLAGGRRSE